MIDSEVWIAHLLESQPSAPGHGLNAALTIPGSRYASYTRPYILTVDMEVVTPGGLSRYVALSRPCRVLLPPGTAL